MFMLSVIIKVSQGGMALLSFKTKVTSSMLTKMPIIRGSMGAKSSSIMKEVSIMFYAGRTSLKWRPRYLGGGMGGEFRMTRE